MGFKAKRLSSMKKLIGIGLLTCGILAGCQNPLASNSSTNTADKPQGLVQMKTKIPDAKLNATLSDLHNQGMKILDIKMETVDVVPAPTTFYDVMYEDTKQ